MDPSPLKKYIMVINTENGGGGMQQVNSAYVKLKDTAQGLVTLLTLDQAQFPDKQDAMEQRMGQIVSNLLIMKPLVAQLDEEKCKLLLDFVKLESMVATMQQCIRDMRWSELYLHMTEAVMPLLASDIAVEDVTKKQPFIENLWESVLSFCEKISLFYLIRTVIPNIQLGGHFVFPRVQKFFKGNYRFVDSWVMFNTILSVTTVFLAWASFVPVWAKYVLVFYGFTRVFEIFIYQMNVIFVHPYRNNGTRYYLKGYRRMTILLLHNFAEIIFWFAGTYLVTKMLVDTNPAAAISQSFIQMLTYSFDLTDEKLPLMTLFVLQMQAVMGVFMTVLSLARFTSLFPQPESLHAKERQLVDPEGHTEASAVPQENEPVQS